ncbi:hypothetical protein A2U01_0090823, partial [Trifolium medium]|nr:hypothetical protein [Trifolium medium]
MVAKLSIVVLRLVQSPGQSK